MAVLWALATLLWRGSASCQAQEALRSTLSLDRSITRQDEWIAPPEQPHLGPVQLALGAYTSVEFNDNVNISETQPEADTLLRVGAIARLRWAATSQSELRFGADLSYVQYVKHSSLGGLEVAPDSVLTWNVSIPDGRITLYDQFTYDRRVVNESALAGTAFFPRLENTVGARVLWTKEEAVFQAGYGHNEFLNTSNAYEYLDHSSEFFFGRAAWQFAERTQAGVETSASLTDYRISVQSDNQSVSVGPYTDWQVTEFLHTSLRGGWTLYEFEPKAPHGSGSELDSYYYGVGLDHQLTPFFSHSISLVHDIRLGLQQGSDHIEQTTATYSLSWAVSEHLSLAANVTYEHGNQPLPQTFYVVIPTTDGYVLRPVVLTRTENFERYGTGISLSWRIREKLSTTLGYMRWERSSNFPGFGYAQNSVLVRLSYDF
jgi:hypothetical protein